MDRSNLRRGNPTVHVKWNSNTAILSGDAMLIKSYELLSHSSVSNPGQIIPVFNETALKVCEGQQYDMDYESTTASVSIDEYLRMVEFKTAVLIAAALKIGAFSGGASKEDAHELYEFGRNIGIAFQIQDYLLEVYADSGLFGKVNKNDIVNKKKTILLVEAMNSPNASVRNELIKWLDKIDFDRDEKVKAVKELYSSLGLKQKVENRIAYYHETAIEHLNNLLVQDEKKLQLRSFSEYLMRRNK
jgi:geranylgeranyl diphosphate synthase type II